MASLNQSADLGSKASINSSGASLKSFHGARNARLLSGPAQSAAHARKRVTRLPADSCKLLRRHGRLHDCHLTAGPNDRRHARRVKTSGEAIGGVTGRAVGCMPVNQASACPETQQLSGKSKARSGYRGGLPRGDSVWSGGENLGPDLLVELGHCLAPATISFSLSIEAIREGLHFLPGALKAGFVLRFDRAVITYSAVFALAYNLISDRPVASIVLDGCNSKHRISPCAGPAKAPVSQWLRNLHSIKRITVNRQSQFILGLFDRGGW